MKYVTIGFDLGFGAIKIYANMGVGVLPSFVSVATREEFSTGDGLTSDKSTKLSFGNQSYYVGRNAHTHGKSLDNMDYDRLLGSPEIKALFYGAIVETFGRSNIPPNVSICAGLPIELLKGTQTRSTATKVKEWLSGSHEWEMGRDKLEINVDEVRITHQPAGALFDYLLDDDGNVANDSRQEVGIVSIGFNTTEILVVKNKQVNQSMSNGGTHGVRRLLELCDPHGRFSLGEMDKSLRSGTLDAEENIKIWSREVKGAIEREWGTRWHRFDRIILVGGGSILLRNHLGFDGKATWPDDPVTSIARGLWKSMQKGG